MTSAPEPRTCPGQHHEHGKDVDPPELGPYDFVCRRCAGRASRVARHLPEIYAELEETLSGLGRTGPRGGPIGSGGESRVLIRSDVLTLRAHSVAIVALGADVGFAPAEFTFELMCEAIADQPQRIRAHEQGPALIRQLHKARSTWLRAIDPDGERVRAGRCPNCDAELWAYRDSETTTCRGCDIEYQTTQLLAKVTARVHDAERPPNEVRKVVAERLGLKVKPATMYTWCLRMKLATWCRVPNEGEPADPTVLCRVGDFVDLARTLQPSSSDAPRESVTA